ncbi:MAG: hypothetical protein IPO92_04585 [Saprospiraceae bacterium]|nr:hypothetical protein [Saprospiraceae bacterium]
MVAKLLLCLYLFSFTPLKEFTRIPLLIFHYHDHSNEDPDMSILQFLTAHYLKGQIKDADFNQDMQLPFKAVNDICTFPLFIFHIYDIDFNLDSRIPNDIISKMIPFDQLFVYKQLSSGTFHPPKNV